MPRAAARTKTVRNQPEQVTQSREPGRRVICQSQPRGETENRTANLPRATGAAPATQALAIDRMLDLFRTCISDEDMVDLYRVLYDKAMQGDVSAAKLVLAYKIGKPAPCPDPDAIDRDEWDHYQQDAIEPQEMKQVLTSLPTPSAMTLRGPRFQSSPKPRT